jgi:hypothetical protein
MNKMTCDSKINLLCIVFFLVCFRKDFIFMCQQLHMEESAHEIMQQLGMNTDSRLTFQDFLHFRTQVRKENIVHMLW